MRYKKGEILITAADAELLKMITLARFITRRQLTYLSPSKDLDAYHADKVRWRLKRFLKEHLVIETRAPLEESFLTITARGLSYLRRLDLEFAANVQGVDVVPSRPSSSIRPHEIVLNELWLTFKKSGHLIRWITSFEISIAAKRHARASYKYYDALAILDMPQGPCQIAIEYERLPKNYRNYPKIISIMKSDIHIPFVLYVCGSERLKENLKMIFRELPKVFFTTERNILARSMSAYIERSSQDLFPIIETLEAALVNVRPAEPSKDF